MVWLKREKKVVLLPLTKKAVIKEVIAALKSDDALTPSSEDDSNEGGE